MSLRPVAQRDDGRWHYRRSLASRVTVLTMMAVGLSVAFVALGAYVTARVQLQAATDAGLVTRAEAAAQDLANTPTSSAGMYVAAILSTAGIKVAWIDPEGHVISYSSNKDPLPLGEPERAVAARDSPQSIRTVTVDGERQRVVAVPRPNSESAIVLSQSLAEQDQLLSRLQLVTLLFGLAGVIAATLAGFAVAHNGLRPVRKLTESVERIGRTEDLTPLPVEGDDEIARLATAFNTLLGGIAASRHRQRQLVADAGHELRTPLTSLRTNLDLLAMADKTPGGDASLPPEARAELLDDVSAQIGELTTLINDLVELARDDPRSAVVETVDLMDVVQRAIARVQLRAPSITFEPNLQRWHLQGEAPALERAVTNLLDNAAKWSPPGGVVTVRLTDGLLAIADQGPGIAEEDLPHVFDRFYRSTESRSMPGSGLGLSIVRQVAERHGGTTRAATGPEGGALMTMRLPGNPA